MSIGKFRVILLATSLSLAGPLAAAAPAAPVNGWGVTVTDVQADPSVRLGTLANGMKYAIMKNGTPRGAASVRLHFDFGSLGEGEKERGLAHFIEHMALNETNHVAEGELIKMLERLGLKFGPDTNAMTSFDATVYMLDLPQTDAERVDTALFLMREVASEARFTKEAVDRERGVILGERRSRDSFQLRQLIDQLSFQVPQTPYPERLPIGTEEVLKTASADTIRDLYRRYYRPENATLIFVGDIDPGAIEAKIKAKFADWTGVGPAGAKLPRGTVNLKRPAAIDTFTDPAVATTVNMTLMRPWLDPADTVAERRRKLVESFANSMFSKRLAKLVNAPGSVLLASSAATGEWEQAALTSGVTLVAKDGAWREALTTAEQEMRRALTHGFTETELKRQLAETTTAYRTAAEQADTRTSSALASAILNTVGEYNFVTTPAWRLATFLAAAPGITLDEVNAAFRRQWQGSAALVHVSDKQPLDTAAIGAALAASLKQAVARPSADAALAFGYDDFGPAGTIVEDKRIEDLGIRTLRFANNVRLNFKQTDFEKGRVRFTVRMAGGQLALPHDKPGLAAMLSILSTVSATGKHSYEDIKALMAGKVVTPGAQVASDAIVAAGSTTPHDLEAQMKLSAAYLTDPGYRAEAAAQWTNVVPVIDKQFTAQPQSVAQVKLPAILANNDWRFGMPDAAVLQQRNFDEARALLGPLASNAPIEIGIVGDIDERAAIAAVAKSFGALPMRAAAIPDYAEARRAAFRRDRSPIELTHEGPADQAMVGIYWPTTDDRDYRQEVAMDLLAGVFDLMLTESVREQLGASYGVSVASNMSDTYRDFGTLSVSTIVAPEQAEVVEQAILAAARELRDRPVPADLLVRARNPALESIARSLRENSYWMGVVDEAQSRADRLDRFRQRRSLYESVTAEELQKLARIYLTEERLQKVRILSDKLSKSVASAK